MASGVDRAITTQNIEVAGSKSPDEVVTVGAGCEHAEKTEEELETPADCSSTPKPASPTFTDAAVIVSSVWKREPEAFVFDAPRSSVRGKWRGSASARADFRDAADALDVVRFAFSTPPDIATVPYLTRAFAHRTVRVR